MPENTGQEASLRLNVAMIIPCTEAEGPGRRLGLWVQGCPMRCPGCCNPEMLEFVDRRWATIPELLAEILAAREQHGIEGITVLGGEPFSQAEALAALAQEVRAAGLSVMVFSGYTAKALRGMKRPGVAALLAATDLLVDGPFVREQLDRERRWIGSLNQQTHDLTGRYRELVESWDTSPNTLEIRVIDGRLVVNGSPFLMDRLGRLTRLDEEAPEAGAPEVSDGRGS